MCVEVLIFFVLICYILVLIGEYVVCLVGCEVGRLWLDVMLVKFVLVVVMFVL